MMIYLVCVWRCHLWKGEQCIEWMGPLLDLNENTAGALRGTLWPLEDAAASVLEEKEHRSNRPPSDPTKKVSESQGDRAREVTPTALLPRACGQQYTQLLSMSKVHINSKVVLEI